MTDNKDICKWLERINDELRNRNKLFKQTVNILQGMEDNLMLKQFDEMDAPPVGTVIQNMRGLVAMNVQDFEELLRNSDEDIVS